MPAARLEIPWHLRQRILDFAHLHPDGGARGIAVELRRRGTPATTAHVEFVLRTLDPAERARVYGPSAPVNSPRSGQVTGPKLPQAYVCGSCGKSLNARGLCSCS